MDEVGPYPCVGVVPAGGYGTGVLQGRGPGAAYPFVRPAADVRGVLADAHVDSHASTLIPPFTITWLAGMDKAVNCGATADPDTIGTGPDHTPRHDADVVIHDAAGAIVIDSTDPAVSYRGRAWGPRLRLHEWVAPDAYCRLLQHTGFADADAVRLVPAIIKPADGRLDERASAPPPLVLRRARADNDLLPAGPVLLDAGYNVEIAPRETVAGPRRIAHLILSAAPGGGIGRAPGCVEEEVLLRSINGATGDAAGNLTLTATGCLWIRQPFTRGDEAATPTAGTLVLGGDCGPCCECDDFAAVQQGVLQAWGDYAEAARVARETACRLQQFIARWEAQRGCRTASSVRINALPHGAFVEVAISVCNPGPDCLTDVTAQLVIATDPATPVATAGVATTTDGRGGVAPWYPTLVPDPDLPGRAMIAIAWPLVPPRSAVTARLRLQIAGDVSVAIDLTAADAAGPLPGAAGRVVTVPA
jgi:hypothetical protein